MACWGNNATRERVTDEIMAEIAALSGQEIADGFNDNSAGAH